MLTCTEKFCYTLYLVFVFEEFGVKPGFPYFNSHFIRHSPYFFSSTMFILQCWHPLFRFLFFSFFLSFSFCSVYSFSEILTTLHRLQHDNSYIPGGPPPPKKKPGIFDTVGFSGLCSDQQLSFSPCWIEHLFLIIIRPRSSIWLRTFYFMSNYLWTVIFGICPISRVPRHD